MALQKLPGSFRDPSGFVYRSGDTLYRQINGCYAQHYDLLLTSGLYAALLENGWLIAHSEVDRATLDVGPPDAEHYKTIQPELVPYVSYPYEWSFSQLKDAALLTLDVQGCALEHGMSLKDATAYNVQFIGTRPVFIDTLSFERYVEGDPWIAYRQFCQHFLGPLAVMGCRDVRLRHLLKSFIDGLPLDLVSRLLPRRTYATYSFLAHIHLHAASQKRHEHDGRSNDRPVRKTNMSKTMQLALVASLKSAVQKCRLPKMQTEWGDYYEDTNYSADGMSAKEQLVAALIEQHVAPDATVHDVGANTGKFSRIVAASGRYVLSHDIDELAVERNYLFNKTNGIDGVLPLLLDLANPAPGIGWALQERDSLTERMAGDTVLALALVHHIVISNNVPLAAFATYLRRLAKTLIIEFVPKQDSQVQRLLATREDIFADYDIEHFEAAFAHYFTVLDKQPIEQTERTLFVFAAA